MLKKLSAPRAALFLAALAVVSALLTNFVTYLPNTDNFPMLGNAPLLPGIYFGIVICVGVFLWEERGPLELLVVLVGVVIAWILAYRTAISVHDFLNRFHADTPGNIKSAYIFAITGLVSGLVGSLCTVIAVSLASPDFREHGDWLRTIALGTAAGALMHFGDAPPASFLPLFIVWQAAVAASVAYGLVIPRRKRKR
jgi:Mn2+/Fe2+ NRAMP family transporter